MIWIPGNAGRHSAFSFPFSNPLRNTLTLAILAFRKPYKPRDFAIAGRSHTVEIIGSNPMPPIEIMTIVCAFSARYVSTIIYKQEIATLTSPVFGDRTMALFRESPIYCRRKAA